MLPTQFCPVCASDDLTAFLHRRQVPTHQHLVVPTAEAARRIGRGELDLHCCRRCGFVFNAAFDPSLLPYDERYDNSQTCSPIFRDHVEERARRVVSDPAKPLSRFVEIGCGKGLFLQRLVELAGPTATGFGFDPTYEGPDEQMEGRLRFVRRFYDAESAAPADAIVCRHVIEHVADPVRLLRTVRQAIGSSRTTRVFFETPCVEWILRHRVVWDFFYEHCSYFSAASLSTAFVAAGFQVERVHTVFGGQYLWLEAIPAETSGEISFVPGEVVELAQRFRTAEQTLVDGWRTQVRNLAARGRLAVWGAGAKGTTFTNLVDPESDQVVCVVDLNPNKQGRFLPGTGHPIVAPRELQSLGVVTAVVLNPNYLSEIQQLLREQDLSVRVLLLADREEAEPREAA